MQWPLVLIFYLVVQGGDFCCVLFPSVYCPATTAKKRCAYKAINFIKEMMRYFFWHFFKSRTIVLPITSPYICVVARFLCPNSFCTVVILAPLYINKVALVWRAEWNEKCLFILANLPIRISSLFTLELFFIEKNELHFPRYFCNRVSALPSNNRLKGYFTSAPVLTESKISHNFPPIFTTFFSFRLTKSE